VSLRTHTVGEGPDVMFLLGFGINFDQPGTRWLMDSFKEKGYETTFVMVPTDLTDFRTELVDPAKEIETSLGDPLVIGLSLGGLVASYMGRSRRRIFLSPFWGVHDTLRRKGLDLALQKLKKVRYRLLPRVFTVADAGYFAVEDDLVGIPAGLSFSTLSQMVSMQQEMPPLREDDVVYRSKQDFIISHNTIDEKARIIREYDGGHLIHLVKDRDLLFSEIFGLLDDTINPCIN